MSIKFLVIVHIDQRGRTMGYNVKKLGAELRRLRVEAGYKNTKAFHDAILEATGEDISPNVLSSIESRGKAPDVVQLVAISRTLFGVSLANEIAKAVLNSTPDEWREADTAIFNEHMEAFKKSGRASVRYLDEMEGKFSVLNDRTRRLMDAESALLDSAFVDGASRAELEAAIAQYKERTAAIIEEHENKADEIKARTPRPDLPDAGDPLLPPVGFDPRLGR